MGMGIELDAFAGADDEQGSNPDAKEVSGLLTDVVHDFIIGNITNLVSVDPNDLQPEPEVGLADSEASPDNEWVRRNSALVTLASNLVAGFADDMKNAFDICFTIDDEVLSAVSINVEKDLSNLTGKREDCAYQAGNFCYWMSRLKPIKLQLPGDVLKLVDKVALEAEDYQRLHYCVHETEFQNSLQFPINEYVSIFAGLMLMNSVKTGRRGSPFYFADAGKLDAFVGMLSQNDLGKDGIRIILEILFGDLLASYARPADASH